MRRQTSHLDADALAEYRAGLITGRRRRQIAAHLAACERCAAVGEELAELSTLLAAIPVPAMPDSVAQRLDAVLAAEVARMNDPERAGGDRSRHRKRAPRPGRRPGRQLLTLRVLAPVAAAVAFLAAGGYGLSLIGAQSTSSSATAGSAAAPAASAIPSAASASYAPAGRTNNAALSPQAGPDYLPATLRPQLEAALRAAAANGALKRAAQSSSAQLRACVQRLTRGISPGTLELVQSAHFQGRPVTVIIASSHDGYVAWVVAPGCSATSADVLARITLPGISAP
jgi:hypothetical protein